MTAPRLLATLTASFAAASVASAEPVFVLEDVGTTQQLFSFDSASPSQTSNRVTITGLENDGEVLGIDFRPQTGELFGFTSNDNLFTLDTDTGAATIVGNGFADSLEGQGSFFGFDFNPVVDLIRIVSDTGTNIVVDEQTGSGNIADTTPLFFASGDVNEGATPTVVGIAYDNSIPNPTTTQLRAVDAGLDVLATLDNNAGELETIGSLGVDFIDILEFDVSGSTGVGYIAGIERGTTDSALFTVDLLTGAATRVGTINSGTTIAGIAVLNGPAAAVPTPGAAAAGLALLGGVLARRKRTA